MTQSVVKDHPQLCRHNPRGDSASMLETPLLSLMIRPLKNPNAFLILSELKHIVDSSWLLFVYI